MEYPETDLEALTHSLTLITIVIVARLLHSGSDAWYKAN